MSIFDEMAADAQTLPNDDRLKRVSELAEKQIALEDEVAAIEEALEAKKKQLFDVANYDLPNAMTEVGIKEFKLVDGQKVTVKPYYAAKIDDDNRQSCHNWLEEHGHADIIKHQIGINFGKGESEESAQVISFLKEHGFSYTDKEGVHYQTLTAFVREMIETGREFPQELFRVHIGQVSKIKRR